MSLVLAIDAGTTTLKMAVIENGETTVAETQKAYPMNIRPGGEYDLDPAHWWNAFLAGCKTLSPHLHDVQAIGLSVSTPGAMAFDCAGNPLTPAVLFLDGRSGADAQWIRDTVGEENLLQYTSNLPVSGGCTASTLVWWKNHQSALFETAVYFGHTNTFLVKRLTGQWGMDPSTASLTALYNTTANDGSWNEPFCEKLGIPLRKLPPIIPSWEAAGTLLPQWAKETGLPAGIPVLMGGNDAMCAALHGGVTREGAILDVCGTCEILCIGLAKSIPSPNYNIRCHIIPGLWSTLYVLNTGGKALEWFHSLFCRDMTPDTFYREYLPSTINHYVRDETERDFPEYDVFLAGDRYSTEKKFAAFSRLSLETNRENLLMALIKGNTQYLARHLDEMGKKITLSTTVHLTGGGISPAFIECKKRWMGAYNYVMRDNSSLLGAAQLAHYHGTGEKRWESSEAGHENS